MYKDNSYIMSAYTWTVEEHGVKVFGGPGQCHSEVTSFTVFTVAAQVRPPRIQTYSQATVLSNC
jgi:hypothetical protein